MTPPTIVILAVENQKELALIRAEYPRGTSVDGITLVEHSDDLTAALTMLERLTPDQLHLVRMEHLPVIQRRAATRANDAALRLIQAQLTMPPPEACDVLADEGDEPLEPTDVVDTVAIHRLADDGGAT